MAEIRVDVAILGAGTAGLAAFRAAREEGARAMMIDGGELGTTCARVGCMPSKLLIAAANAAHAAAPGTGRLDTFGIRLDAPLRIDGPAVLQRVRAERDRFAGQIRQEMEHFPNGSLLRGYARFTAPGRLAVGRDTVVARACVIATGARPSVPPLYADLGELLATSDTLFEWPDLPTRVAVVGTGLIALELGQALARLGVAVTMIGHSGSIASLSDPEVTARAAALLDRAFTLYAKAEVLSVERHGAEARLRWRTADGTIHDGAFERVLVATGRRPVVSDLGLDAAGLALDEHGMPCFDRGTLRCGEAPVFVAGDVTGERPWLNDAANEGRIAGSNAARWPQDEAPERPVALSIVFSDPQILLVGQHFEDLDAERIVIGQAAFEEQGRSRVEQVNQGLLRLYVARDDHRLLGAEGIAPHGEHLAHLLGWAVQAGLCVEQCLTMPFYHPVFEEAVRTALRDAMRQLVELTGCGQPKLADAIGT